MSSCSNQKRCKSCKKKKDTSSFHKNGRGGRQATCASCRNKRRRESWNNSYSLKPDVVYRKYKGDAKKRGLKFELSKEDFFSFQNLNCYYCGVGLDRIRLDRIDNSKGYVLENLVSCCKVCNFLKGSYSQDVFMKQIYSIYLYQKEIQSGE